MKVVIFAGGLGSRIGEETTIKPKPMIDICGKPILMHIMDHYASYGHTEFIVLGGYKCDYIKDYFLNYRKRHVDICVDLHTDKVTELSVSTVNYKVTILDTGLMTLTGNRLAQAAHLLRDKPFMLTYGDGMSNIDLNALLDNANRADKIVTMSIVTPKMRFGTVDIDAETNTITNFNEKLVNHDRVNGGFMVVKPDIFDYIPSDKNVMFEADPLQNLVKIGQINAFIPDANTWWHAIDTIQDKTNVEAYLTAKHN